MARTEEVQRLTEHGCSVLCLGCPEGRRTLTYTVRWTDADGDGDGFVSSFLLRVTQTVQ